MSDQPGERPKLPETMGEYINTRVRPQGSASGPPKLASMPRCKRCGTSVDRGIKFCETCQEIVDAGQGPKAMLELGTQHAPPYTEPE